MLDASGNINTAKLAKELQSALDADIKYKQTDNMKKKACKAAGSYDEFRAMVCLPQFSHFFCLICSFVCEGAMFSFKDFEQKRD